MKKLFTILLLVSFTAFFASAQEDLRDHVPKVEKVDKVTVEKAVAVEAAVIADVVTPADLPASTVVEVAGDVSPPLKMKSGSIEMRSNERSITPGIPRIRDSGL